ncbi:TPA: phosphoribosylanthranilate isomerase, partial [Klebsiella pneumoniae]
ARLSGLIHFVQDIAAVHTPVRIKICGITRVEDALAAAEAGADAIGLVFYARSPRALSIARAQAIVAALPPFVCSVGLFVDHPAEQVADVLREVPLDLLQFHGDESAAYCAAFSRPYIKALRVRAGEDLAAQMAAYRQARGILLDTYVAGVPGGTGQAFDWSLIPTDLPQPVILAGGLDAGNAAAAVARVRPYALDVSGGVEQAKGIKDARKIRDFIAAARSG